MKVAFRNRKKFYYALYLDKVEIIDDKGFKTGEWETGYSSPILAKANISPATGNSNTEQFGNLENYDKVIVTDDMSIPIDENSILWVDQLDTEQEHDYIVKRVAKSLNVVSIAIAKVNVSNE